MKIVPRRVAAVIVGFALAAGAAACASHSAKSSPDSPASELYAGTCASCHGPSGEGGQGPRIGAGAAKSKYSRSEMIDLVTTGRAGMPAFADRLSAQEIELVVDYARDRLGRSDGDETTTTAPRGKGRGTLSGIPPELADDTGDWAIANGDYLSQRVATGSHITSKTVGRLKAAWTAEIPGGATFGNLTTTPIVSGDSVYVGALDTLVHVLDRRTGKERWVSGEKTGIFGPTGVGLGYGMVFGTTHNDQGKGAVLVAYDAKTGKRRWATDLSENGGDINMQPSVYDGLVFASTSGYGAGTRATIYAVDAETGAIVWDFPVIDDALFGNPDVNSGGGVWYPPTIDTKRGIAYFGTGNPYPFPGAKGYPNGSSRPGDNKWTDSILALDVETGKLAWGWQALKHDIFDRDSMLTGRVDLEIDGTERSIALSTGKLGVVTALDADRGKVLWRTKVGRHQNDELTEITGKTLVYPGSLGGAQTPLAIADGVAYLCVMNAPTEYAGPEETSYGFSVKLGTADSELVAMDLATGKILWDEKLDGDALGGATVVNDLVFTSTFGGTVLAFDRDTGKQVWSYEAGGGINGWPAIAGDEVYVPVGIGKTPKLVKLRLPTSSKD